MTNPRFQYRLSPQLIEKAEYLKQKWGLSDSQLVSHFIVTHYNIETNKDKQKSGGDVF